MQYRLNRVSLDSCPHQQCAPYHFNLAYNMSPSSIFHLQFPPCPCDHHNLISDRDLANATTLTKNEEFIHKVMQFHDNQIHGHAHMKWIACGALNLYITVAYHMMLKKSTSALTKERWRKGLHNPEKTQKQFSFFANFVL